MRRQQLEPAKRVFLYDDEADGYVSCQDEVWRSWLNTNMLPFLSESTISSRFSFFVFFVFFLTAMTTCFSVNGSLFITFKFPIDHGEGPHMNVAVCFYSPLVMSGETQQGWWSLKLNAFNETVGVKAPGRWFWPLWSSPQSGEMVHVSWPLLVVNLWVKQMNVKVVLLCLMLLQCWMGKVSNNGGQHICK